MHLTIYVQALRTLFGGSLQSEPKIAFNSTYDLIDILKRRHHKRDFSLGKRSATATCAVCTRALPWINKTPARIFPQHLDLIASFN